MKILIAVDGSEFTRKMLDYLTMNNSLFSAAHQYTVFNSQARLPGHAAHVVGSNVTEGFHHDEAHKVTEPAVAALRSMGATNVDAQYMVGDIGETIGRFAQEGGYDMIVMGSHGHGSLKSALMGSAANEVLANCKVPVLLVR